MKKFIIDFSGDKKISIDEGQTILQASLSAGIPHYHSCGGNAQCSTCRILIHEGMEIFQLIHKKKLHSGRRCRFHEINRKGAKHRCFSGFLLVLMVKEENVASE